MNKPRQTHQWKFLIITLIVLLLSCQGTSNLPNPFATETPTSTATSTLTPSPMPSPTPTITLSPTPRPTGVQFKKLPNGVTQVVDYDNKYVLLLSASWLALPGDATSFQNAIEQVQENDPDLADTFDRMKYTLQDDTLRLVSFNRNKDLRDGKFFPNLIVAAIKDSTLRAMPLDFLVEMNVEQIKSDVSYATVADSGTDKNKNDVEYGFIIVDSKKNQSGKTINDYQTLLILKGDSATIVMYLTIPSSRKELAGPVVQDIIDSIYLYYSFPDSSG